jgi:hypothetical protein
MNRILLFLVSLLFVTACEPNNSENTSTSPSEETTTVASTQSAPAMMPVDSAKALLIEAQGYMEKGIRKEMPGPDVNEKMKPIMAQFMEIYKRLPPADTATIYQFRIKQYQEMVNLQVKVQSNK